MTFPMTIILAAILIIAICGTVVFMSAMRAARTTIEAPPTNDTELLDYLESAKQHLFFNKSSDAWGVLTTNNKLVAAGGTVRAAIANAQLKDATATYLPNQQDIAGAQNG